MILFELYIEGSRYCFSCYFWMALFNTKMLLGAPPDN
jgi:hypothetical protein